MPIADQGNSRMSVSPIAANLSIRVLLGLVMVSAVISALIGIYMLITEDDSDGGPALLGLFITAVVYLCIATCAAYVMSAGRMVAFMWVAIACALGSWLMFATVMIWERDLRHGQEEI